MSRAPHRSWRFAREGGRVRARARDPEGELFEPLHGAVHPYVSKLCWFAYSREDWRCYGRVVVVVVLVGSGGGCWWRVLVVCGMGCVGGWHKGFW